MKTVVVSVGFYLLGCLISWGFGGFIALNWDVTQWEELGRFALIWFAFAPTIFFMVLYLSHRDVSR